MLLLVGLLLVLGTGCVKYKSLVSYTEGPQLPANPQAIANYTPIVIQANDILHVQINSTSEIAAAAFNTGNQQSSNGNQQNSLLNGYLVDSEGMIELPTLGAIKLSSLTLAEAKKTIKEALKPYFTETPIVNIRLLNFKVTINGEVKNPGTFTVNNGRITMVEALTMAGDFTPYSRRDSILIIREFDNERSFGYIDFNTSEVFRSPYYYLQQNDVVYVKPQTSKTTTVRDPASKILPYVSVLTSLTAFVISIFRN